MDTNIALIFLSGLLGATLIFLFDCIGEETNKTSKKWRMRINLTDDIHSWLIREAQRHSTSIDYIVSNMLNEYRQTSCVMRL